MSDHAHLPLVVLLGEPGMGKTTVLEDTRALTGAEGRQAIWIDLDRTGNEDRLRDELTTSRILQAGSTAPPADLLIDGLDTGLLAIRTLAFLLADVFRQYPRGADLRVRLACRTAVWPSSLEDALVEHWGKAEVGVFELAPLRERDVALAAAAEGLDADTFLEPVKASHAGPLANRPVTLRFLLGLAKDGKPFPTTRVELYRQGCERLCSEQNKTRHETRHHGNRSPSERLLIAARIAAVLMLANREAVWIGSGADMDSERDCSVNDLIGRVRKPDGASLEVSQQDLRETLDTGLFWLRGANRLHFAHQSYGEFLAAWYLQSQDLPAPRKLDLLSGSSIGGLVPQLCEVAAWAASTDRDLFRSILAIQPPVLLTSDVVAANPGLREELVGGVLTLADKGEWADTQWGLRKHYGKLGHPGLADQLLPWIQDKSRFIVARRIAIEIAEVCELRELQDALVTLALDSTEQAPIRGLAVDALREIGDLSRRSSLLPLLDLSPKEDPEDELAGDAMRALWPDAIELSDLLARIRPRRSPSLSGSHWGFLSIELPPSLSPCDLPEALRWARARISTLNHSDDGVRITSAVVARALQHIDAPGVAEELATTVLPLLYRGLLMSDIRFRDSTPLRSEDIRKRFVLVLMPRLQNIDVDAYMLTSKGLHGIAIRQNSDLPWLLDLAVRGASPTTCWTFARLIAQLRPLDHANTILEACARNDVLRRALVRLCGMDGLDSGRARAAREHIARLQEQQEERRHRLPVPPPDERIALSLSRVEQGDANAFVTLTRDLGWEVDGGYIYSTSVDLRRLPGWIRADPAKRARIVAASARYIKGGTLDHDRMLQAGQPTACSNAAVEALFLLDAEAAESGGASPQPDWCRWAPVALYRFVSVESGGEEQAWAEDLLRRAYAAAPKVVHKAIRQHLDRDLEQGYWAPTARGLEPIWNVDIAHILLTAAKAARGESEIFSSLFDTLVRQGSAPARDYGLKCIAALPLRASDAERTTAVRIATRLVKHRTTDAWPLVWSTMQRNAEFARLLILACRKGALRMTAGGHV